MNVVVRSSNRIRNAFRFKDQISKYMNSIMIYKFKCNIYNDVYIGKTKCNFLVREYEHLGDSVFNSSHRNMLERTVFVAEISPWL